MPQTVLFIAISLDGYIAKPDGNIDWLTSTPSPQSGDYGYADLLNSIGTIIMGRKTYDEILGFGIDWPYTAYRSYVVSHNPNSKVQSPNTYLLNDNLSAFIKQLKATEDKDIWVVGGGQLVTSFINDGLLDKMIISVIPKIIGEGIPLFAPKPQESNWQLIEAKAFDTGVVNLIYEKPIIK